MGGFLERVVLGIFLDKKGRESLARHQELKRRESGGEAGAAASASAPPSRPQRASTALAAPLSAPQRASAALAAAVQAAKRAYAEPGDPPGAASAGTQGYAAPRPPSEDPALLIAAALDAAREGLDQAKAATPKGRQALIREALSIRREKEALLDQLPPEERQRLQALALAAVFGLPKAPD